MRLLSLLVVGLGLGLGLAACGSSLDACERAAGHAYDCDARDAFRWNNNNECKEPDLCLAQCISKTPCPGLRGEDPAASAALTTCLDACPGGPDL